MPLATQLPRLRVSPDRHFLMTSTGAPFFWLGDTAWELFHRLTPDEAEVYLETRSQQGFTLIQAVALAEFDGLHTPNAQGVYALHDDDPTRPNEAYFQYIDDIIQLADAKGLYLGLLPTWGDKLTPMWGVGPAIFTEENAAIYGCWLGERYRSATNLVWILGGDRPAEHEGRDFRPIWQAMAEGIRVGAGEALITWHPSGGHSSSEWLQGADWLDIHMLQSGHGSGRDTPCWEMIEHDYLAAPIRPVLDGEPNYEDHPVNPWPTWDPANGYFEDDDVRKQLYRSVFAGGCGVTYGHHSIWQFCNEARYPGINHVRFDWQTALQRPGATQVRYLRQLLESRPFFSRIPDQSLIASPIGERGSHIRATRDSNGSYAFVYLPQPGTVALRLDALRGEQLSAAWYDPRTGNSQPIGKVSTHGLQSFTTPTSGPDWVLVLDAHA